MKLCPFKSGQDIYNLLCPFVGKIRPVVLVKNILTTNARRTTHDDRRQPIAIAMERLKK